MSYRVVWRPRAISQLTDLWVRSTNRDALNGYAQQIDRILERDPHEQGESRADNYRLWFRRPLSVLFQIDEPTRTVFVVAVKWVGR